MYRTDRIPLAAPAVDDLVAKRVSDGRAPASSFALFTPDGVVATGHAGDVAGEDVAFRVASCTKSFTVATLLSLEADGLLDLSMPVTEYVPLAVLGGYRAPTLAELAAMSGGIPYDDPWADRQESLSQEAMAALVADGVRLVREPGSGYEYSSYGYAILGSVVEAVTGDAYPAVVRQRVIDPLGLPVGFDRASVGAIAPGFVKVDGEWVEQPWQEPGGFSALGGIIASPSALATWAGWLAAGYRDGDDAVLPRDARRSMQVGRTPIPDSTARYGLGLMVDEHPRHGTIVNHSGGYPGYGANMRWHPASGIGVVILENARYSGASVPAAKALLGLLDAAFVPDAELDLWPETREARDVVERLLRSWDDAALERAAADNVALDRAFADRRAEAERLRERVGLSPDAPVAPLADAAPHSESPAHVAWTVFGPRGAVRCEIRLTPTRTPRLETVDLRL